MSTLRSLTLAARLPGPRIAGPAAAVAALVLLAGGCTHATLTNVWRDPTWSGHALQGMLVVSREPDAAARRLTEDVVAQRLRQAGTPSVCAYTLFESGAPSQSQMTSAMREHDLDGALVIKPLRATTQTEWVPGWRSVEPRAYYDPWRERSVIVYRSHRHPGYRVTDHVQRLQLTLWAGESNAAMVWAGTLEDENPGSKDALRDDLAQALVPGLRQAGLLETKPHPA